MPRRTEPFLRPTLPLLAAALLLAAASARSETDAAPADLAVHAQATWVVQHKPGFAAAYTGPHSMRSQAENASSFTSTVDLGYRPWRGGQLHFNPEAARGIPLSDLTGAGGLSNGELARGSSSRVRFYRARLYLQQRVDLDGPGEDVQPGFNELGGRASQRRWTFTVGNFSLLDFFDPNPYAKDPRTQFLNWSFLTHGAWDYAADARGYTNGAIAEYRAPGWALRFGRAAQPKESNGLALDGNLRRQYGDQVEAESDLPAQWGGRPLRARLLLFRNRVRGGSYNEALAATPPGGTPDVATVRRLQDKRGGGLTLEAPTGDDTGLFLRASRSDGAVETYAFTEIDRQLALGGQFQGARPADRWGAGVAINGLSGPHRSYLAAGGLGFFLGDGRLNYGSERVLEGWYRWELPLPRIAPKDTQHALSIGVQHIVNPGYNRDRGPVETVSLRWHAQF